MQVGTVGAGRIGSAVLRRLKPFDVGLHYTDRQRLPDLEQELGLTWHPDAESLVKVCDVVTINTPLHPETEHMFDDELLGPMKRGAYLVNTARGKICDRDAVVRALESGQLAGYAGDVWFPQPAPSDHPWRTMPWHGMTPHTSGTSLSAQARYAAGTREILECWFEDRPIREEYLIVDGGQLAGTGAKSYSGRRDRWLGGGRPLQGWLTAAESATARRPGARRPRPSRRVVTPGGVSHSAPGRGPRGRGPAARCPRLGARHTCRAPLDRTGVVVRFSGPRRLNPCPARVPGTGTRLEGDIGRFPRLRWVDPLSGRSTR